VTPNRGMGPSWGAFCQITLTSCYWLHWLYAQTTWLLLMVWHVL